MVKALIVKFPQLLLKYFYSRLTRIQFIAMLATVVGIVSGLLAVLLKTVVHYIQHFVSDYSYVWYFYVLFPAAGILLSVIIVKRFYHGKIEKGIEGVLNDIEKKGSRVHMRKTFSNFFTSMITVSLGGSSGLEGPVVASTAPLGPNIGKPFNLTFRERTLLLACGASAGISAMFNAPVTGMIFAVEVILADAAVANLITLMIASVSGALCSMVILQENIFLKFNFTQSFNYQNVPYYAVLGILCGFVSLYYARINHKMRDYFATFGDRVYLRAIIGGIVLMVLCFFFPPLFGEGFVNIKSLADGRSWELLRHTFFESTDNTWILLGFCFAVMMMKVFATSATIYSGGNGGVFAPSLFVGAYMGFIFSRLVNFLNLGSIPESNFTVVGMAGILSGVMFAPLTAIFLIAEVTGSYNLFIPLMIVSSISFFIVRQLDPNVSGNRPSVFVPKPKRRSQDAALLSDLSVLKLVEKDIQTISPDDTLGHLVELIKGSKRNIFAVVNQRGEYLGTLLLDHIKDIMFNHDLYNKVKIGNIMYKSDVTVDVEENMESIISKLDNTIAWNLPVLDGKKYVGFISKSGVYKQYREAHKSGVEER